MLLRHSIRKVYKQQSNSITMETKRIKARGYDAEAVVMGANIIISIPFECVESANSAFDKFKVNKS